MKILTSLEALNGFKKRIALSPLKGWLSVGKQLSANVAVRVANTILNTIMNCIQMIRAARDREKWKGFIQANSLTQ